MKPPAKTQNDGTADHCPAIFFSQRGLSFTAMGIQMIMASVLVGYRAIADDYKNMMGADKEASVPPQSLISIRQMHAINLLEPRSLSGWMGGVWGTGAVRRNARGFNANNGEVFR